MARNLLRCRCSPYNSRTSPITTDYLPAPETKNMRNNDSSSSIKKILLLALVIVLASAILPSALAALLTTINLPHTISGAIRSPAGDTQAKSWMVLATPRNQNGSAGSPNSTVGPGGFVSLRLAPLARSIPANTYRSAVDALRKSIVPGSALPAIGASDQLPTSEAAAANSTSLDTLYNPCRGYGLACDGATTDSQAWQSFINTICSLGGNASVMLPNKRIALTAQSVIFNGCAGNLHIYGTGDNSGFLFTSEDSNGSGLVIENNSAHKVELDHFHIAGPTYRALAISQSSNVYIHDLSIQEASQGLVSGLGGAIWIQGGTHVHIDHNVLTNNGPAITGAARNCRDKNNQPTVCPQGYTFVANPNYFAGHLSQSTTTDLQVTRNTLTDNNTQIALALYNTEYSTISDNYVDQNNAYKNDTTTSAETGQGYGINVYGNAHVGRSSGNWVSTVLSGNAATTTMTNGSVIPYVIGQWVCANSALGVSHNTDFGGCYQITALHGSGSAAPTFTWTKIGSDDTTSGIDIVDAVVGTTLTGNHVTNAAGACIYTQSLIDGHIDENVVWNCAQMLPTTSIPMAGITVSGATRLTVNNNSVNTVVNVNMNKSRDCVYTPDGIAAVLSYDSTYNGNTITNFTGDGILFEQGRLNTISGNTIDGASVGSSGIHAATGAPLNLLTVSHNTIHRVTYAGINAGGRAPSGYGTGLIVGGNDIGGNTASAQVSYCIQLAAGIRAATIDGNSCDGYGDTSVSSGRTMHEGIDDGALSTHVTNNTVANVADYGFLESGTDAILTGNSGYNNNNPFAATGSRRSRVYGNVFGVYSSLSGVGVVWNTDTLHYGNQFTDGMSSGTCTLSSGMCTVSTHEIQSWSMVRFSPQAAGGTPGTVSLGAVTPNISFVIKSSSASDTSTVFWEIVH